MDLLPDFTSHQNNFKSSISSFFFILHPHIPIPLKKSWLMKRLKLLKSSHPLDQRQFRSFVLIGTFLTNLHTFSSIRLKLLQFCDLSFNLFEDYEYFRFVLCHIRRILIRLVLALLLPYPFHILSSLPNMPSF